MKISGICYNPNLTLNNNSTITFVPTTTGSPLSNITANTGTDGSFTATGLSQASGVEWSTDKVIATITIITD